MTLPPLIPKGLLVVRPPYRSWERLDLEWTAGSLVPGAAIAWFVDSRKTAGYELEWLATRPRSMPLFVVLPKPEQVTELVDILKAIPALKPKGVLPGVGAGTIGALRALLAAPPRSLSTSVVDLLQDEGVIRYDGTRRRVEAIFSSAPHTRSIDALARRMCQSRRTLGRHFKDRDLPVPSHWLQFARVLHVSIQLQNTRLSIGRVAARFGYCDGFTMSNTMKRLTGYRPSFVREHLGWEWIVSAWLRREKKDGLHPGSGASRK